MIQLRIEGNEFNIKSSWDEVSFREFINILHINEDSGYNNITKSIKTISVLSDNKEVEKYLFGLSIDDFKKLQDAFSWLSSEMKPGSGKDFFEVDGVKYKMKKNFSKLTVSEMVSFETILKDKRIDAHPFELAFAVLFRRLDANANEVEFNEEDFLFVLTELIDKVNTVEIIEHINFFLSGGKNSTTKNTKDYSFQIIQKTSTECQKPKLKNTKKKKKDK